VHRHRAGRQKRLQGGRVAKVHAGEPGCGRVLRAGLCRLL
jgi:hypothetical protein